MISSPRHQSPHESILRLGVKKAIQSALVACIFVVLLNLLLLAVHGAWRDGIPSPRDLVFQIVTILLIGAVLSCWASILVILPAFIGGLALARLIRTQHAQPSYNVKTWHGFVIGGGAGFLVALLVFLIEGWVGSIGSNVLSYEPEAVWLHTFYVIEFISVGGAAGIWTHRQVSRQLLDHAINEAG